MHTLGVQSPNRFIHLLAIEVTTDENTVGEVRSNAQIEFIYINLLNVRMQRRDYCPRCIRTFRLGVVKEFQRLSKLILAMVSTTRLDLTCLGMAKCTP